MMQLVEVMTEQRATVKHLRLDNVEFTRQTWNMCSTALMTLTQLETLTLVNVRVFQTESREQRVTNVFATDELLDGMLDRNPNLVSLTLRDIGPCLTAKGAATLYQCLEEGRLEDMDLGDDARYEMLRGRPDLWISRLETINTTRMENAESVAKRPRSE